MTLDPPVKDYRAALWRWLTHGLARRWLWVQLGAFALLLALCGADVILVLSHVSCAVYRRTIQGIPGEVVAYTAYGVGGVCCLWRLAAQIFTRRYRAFALSLGILAIEVTLVLAALTLDIDKTLFYCAFEGVSLNACEVGLCVH